MLILYVSLSAKTTVCRDYSRRLTNKTLLVMSSSENSSERSALDINLWQPWGDFFLISPLIHALSRDNLDIWCGIFSWWVTKRLWHKHTQASPSGAECVLAITKAHNRAHWEIPTLASHVLWTEGMHISVISPPRPVLLFLLCFYKEKNMFNPSWTLHGWHSSHLQWALCVS